MPPSAPHSGSIGDYDFGDAVQRFQLVSPFGLSLAVALIVFAVPDLGMAASPSFDVDWGTSPASLEESTDEPLSGSDWRKFGYRTQRVTLHGDEWKRFFIFFEDGLIAQGYRRAEIPEETRHGTVSDIVSYDNDYWMAGALEGQFGSPDLEDVRTKTEYSQELGDPEKRAHRSLEWDLKGERYRWETDAGTVRYAVRYSLKGERDHYAVRVKPGAEKHYHFFKIARAFREAGVRVVRRFEKKSEKMVVAMVTSSGEVVRSEYETEGEELVPVQPEKDQYTETDCEIRDRDCKLTVHTYGGHVYRIDVDLSSSGSIGRRERGGFEEAGERTYRDFLWVNEKLEGRLGEPSADTSIENWRDDRKARRIHDIPKGREAFWTVWYDAGDDVLTRHVISGGHSGAKWHVDHRVTVRLHSVARAFAEESAWKAERQQIEKARDLRREMRERRKEASEENEDSESDDADRETNTED